MAIEAFQRLFANATQIAAAQIEQCFPLERIELQIDLEVFDFRETPGKIFVLRDFQAVSIDHEVSNWPRLSHRNDLEKLRVKRRLAAGNLHDIRMAFIAHNRVKHFFYQRKRAMLGALRAAARVADGASQITGVRDFQE